ncbi:hypothetical protein OE699_02215 [Sedimentimonas flavescens]|uniref:Uncharacterized protein n=1 Tax=Sedimentimonas flavescens TaxID=2851012 RepID=A0ABT2ZV84_9RHOB|nr:hypothetical protein [Sedimentimonas flavescens]MCV2877654.1 hypothetical protein [Sedimentimonas flavescens]
MGIELILASLALKGPAERRRMKENAERLEQRGDDQQKMDARALLDAIDALEATELSETQERLMRQPIGERVAHAFRAIPLSESEQRVLDALIRKPGSTSRELSQELGWAGQAWHLHFGELCKKRQHLLWPAEPSAVRDADFYCGILTSYDPSTSGWTMRSDVLDALAAVAL